MTDRKKLDIAIKALLFYAEKKHIEDYFGKSASFGGGIVCLSGNNPQKFIVECGQTAETALEAIEEIKDK